MIGKRNMDITFRNSKLQRTLNSDRELRRTYGDNLAKKIQMRLNILKGADNLALVPVAGPTRLHALTQNRKGQYAVDLDRRNRLIFAPNHHPIPLRKDGGVDLENVTEITILEVTDYH